MTVPPPGASTYNIRMRWSALFAFCAAAVALLAQDSADRQSPATQNPAPASGSVAESKGLSPRTAPSDYPAHAQAGAVTIAADFTGHNVGTLEGILTTDEYVVIEAAVFGPAGARVGLCGGDFFLRITCTK